MTLMASNGAARTPRDSFMTREEFYEMRNELKAQIAAGELDVGDDGPDVKPTGELTKTVASTPKGHGQGGVGDCFKRLCAAFGANVPIGTTRVCDVPEHELRAIRQNGRQFKIYYEHYDEDDERNHVVAVDCSVNSARVAVAPAGPFSGEFGTKVIGVTSSEQFFNSSNMFARVNFFAETEGLASFGGDMSNVGSPQSRYQRQDRNAPRDQSIVDDRASSGQANVAGGVKRAKRRVVASRSKFSPTGHVAKSYAASPGLMFNNLNEMFQDTVSREYAQEIIEAVFEAWGLPNDEPDALKYGEDLICAFFIATTASNKADFDFVFPIPCHSGEVDAEFSVLSKVLAEQFGVTRRQFARGMADDMRAYIKDPDNTHLRPKLADRAGCDPQMAELAFDGSTHCTGLTSAQLTFTRLLESRNLFEDDAVLSQGTSQTIMEGIHGHVRSKVQR